MITRTPMSPTGRRPVIRFRRGSGAFLLAWFLAVSLAVPLAGPAAAADPSSPSPSAAPTGSHIPVALQRAEAAAPDADTPPATPAASVEHALGGLLSPGLPKGVSTALTGRLQPAASYPASVDLSEWAPPVGDQNPVGSCVSWATGYYDRYWLRNHVDRDETATFAPMYLYSQIAQGHDTGSSFRQNFDIIMSQGIATQTDYWQGNYDYTTQPTPEQHAAAAPYRIGWYSRVFSGAGGGDYRSAVEATLSAGAPVMFMIPVYPNFEAATHDSPLVDVPAAGTTSRGLHGVWSPMYDELGVWIENSWGTAYGRDGWVELSWAFINSYALEAWTMTDERSSVGLSADAPDVRVGTTVTLTATANGDVSPTSYYIVILRNDGLLVKSCGTGTVCTRLVSSSVAASWTYHAVLGTSAGASPVATSPPVTVTWASVPSAPTGVTVVGGTQRATVSWTAPASNGGTAIAGYTVTSAPGGKTCTPTPPTGTTCVVTDLASGTPYTFTVTAMNAVGSSPASAASVPMTLTPTVVTCTPGTPGGAASAATGSTIGCAVTPGSGAGFTGWTATGFTPATSASAAQSFTAGSPGAGSIVAAYVDDLGSHEVPFAYTIATAPAVVRRPDGRIRLGSGAYAGNNVYNTSGAGQSRTGSARRGKTVTFGISIQNDGSRADSFKVRATGTAASRFTVKYFSGSKDITARVVAGTYRTASLAPRATCTITARVTVRSTARAGSKVTRLVTLSSVANSARKDAVKLVARRS